MSGDNGDPVFVDPVPLNKGKGKGSNQTGGMTTGEWGIKTYGEMGQQSAIPGTNVIQMRGGSEGEVPVIPPTDGGMPPLLSAEALAPVVLTIASNQIPKLLRKSLSRKSSFKKSKGGDLTGISVPAVLVITNQMVGKRLSRGKTHKSHGGRKQRRTRRRQ